LEIFVSAGIPTESLPLLSLQKTACRRCNDVFCPGEGGVACDICGAKTGGRAVEAEYVRFIRVFCEKPLDNLCAIKLTQRQDDTLTTIPKIYLSTIL